MTRQKNRIKSQLRYLGIEIPAEFLEPHSNWSKRFLNWLKEVEMRTPSGRQTLDTMKNELLKGKRFNCIDEVKAAVGDAVSFYNNERPHMSIDMKTPVEAALCSGELRKHWESYRENAIKAKLAALEIPKNSLPLTSVHGSPSGLRSTVNP